MVAEEFGNWEDARRRIDLLALDKSSRLVVIEIKRTDDGGHMELRSIRYAAMVSSMGFTEVLESEGYLNLRIVLALLGIVAAMIRKEVEETISAATGRLIKRPRRPIPRKS